MGQKCSCCVSADRQSIDSSIRASESNRVIAGRYGVSRSAVQRHCLHVLKADALASPPIKFRAQPVENPVEDLRALKHRALKWLDLAEEAGSAAAAAVWVREARSIVETIFKMNMVQLEAAAREKDLQEADSLEQDPRWIELRAKIYKVLSGFPEAFRALDDFLIEGDLTPDERRMFAEKPMSPELEKLIDQIIEGPVE